MTDTIEGPFQSRVGDWVVQCFGEAISSDRVERCDRFTEESLELVQSCGYSADRAHALVDYVFNRDVGETHQEVGGTMVTLAALCKVFGVDMVEAGEAELARINRPEIVEKIRRKQAAKPTGSALPIALSLPHRTEADILHPWQLLITGGEDAPGHASTLTLEAAAELLESREADTRADGERVKAAGRHLWNLLSISTT